MNIRIANKPDISNISDIIKKSYATVALRYDLTFDNCPKHPSNCTEQWVEKDFAREVTYYVGEMNNTLIGCVALEKANDEMCYLERLAVLPELRNQGIGLSLWNYALTEARLYCFKTIGIGIIAQQDDLKSWYNKIGFRSTGIKSFSHLPFDVAFMEYSIE